MLSRKAELIVGEKYDLQLNRKRTRKKSRKPKLGIMIVVASAALKKSMGALNYGSDIYRRKF